MDKKYRWIGVVFAVLAMVIFLGAIGLYPFEGSTNEFTYKPFPELNGVAETTIYLEKPLFDYIGSEGNYNRDPFFAEMTVKGEKTRDYSVQLSKRGATSFQFDKHQFSVSFVNDDKVQENRPLLDMPSAEDWTLHGPYLDRSMLRNYIAYKTSFEVMGYAPRAQFTELYIQAGDGPSEYVGLYLWTEKVRRGENRVDVTPTAVNLRETSFIIGKDEYRDGDHLLNVYGKELYMYAYEYVGVYPKTTLSDDQKDYIGDVITEFERVLYHDRYDIPNEGYGVYINESSFIDYYILNEFFMNTDAGNKSTFIHKDIRGPINLGPVWDFNNAMGNVNTLFEVSTHEGLFMHDRMWFDKMLMDPVFAGKVIARYKILRQGALRTEYLINAIDEAYEILKPYAEKDHDLYTEAEVYEASLAFLGDQSPLSDALMNEESPVDDFDDDVEDLKSFIIHRGEWLDEHLVSILRWTE